jgi:anaerobic ribonucleoside-triphosphate reductase activating protein
MMRHYLKVGGFVPFSATDYPDHLCAVVFCQGCPWRCGYCHNPHLQPSRRATAIQWNDMLRFLSARRGLLDAVVFSGGEPTMQSGLVHAISALKALGFKAGLHTAGIYPRRLAALLPFLDWIGLDVKAPFDRYASVTGVRGSRARAEQSLDLVLSSGVPYQLRTTADTTLLGEADLARLRARLPAQARKHHVLQTCRPVRA